MPLPSAPSVSSSSKREAESSPCHESSSSIDSGLFISPSPYPELPSPRAIKRRKIELYEEFAAKDPDLLRSRCKAIEQKLDQIMFEADREEASLHSAVESLKSVNKALQDAQRLQYTAMEAVETAMRTRIDVSNDIIEMSNMLRNLRKIHSLQDVITKRDDKKKAVEERQSAVEKLQNDLNIAQSELQQSEKRADETLDAIDKWHLEFINEDECWSSI
ncbi:hypothetical protein NW752_008255 [Fusarium irregulare]|uniref:Uncharacterized protein n=1 Tax=Fusarium irregulare TaxID=2494466 RepID=A0A9W8PVK0_9HYPO|nr:hypothetical protein NW752_008255 [Fusarium irregulare]KAJ4019492.1 hypothetical protein NW766_003224 [Fusarium irregulare]